MKQKIVITKNGRLLLLKAWRCLGDLVIGMILGGSLMYAVGYTDGWDVGHQVGKIDAEQEMIGNGNGCTYNFQR